MLSGNLDGQNLPDVLRELSQRQLSGVLDLRFPGDTVQICFAQGKISDLIDGRRDRFGELFEKFRRAGYAPATVKTAAQSYAQLYEALSGKSLDLDLFRLAVKFHVLEDLYSLNIESGVPYEFKPQAVSCRDEFSPSISAGQLLLDLAGKDEIQARFCEEFGMDGRLVRTEAVPQFRCREEELVYAMIDDAASAGDLLQRSLLGALQTESVLAALYERGLIDCRRGGGSSNAGGSEKPAGFGLAGRVAFWNATLLHDGRVASLAAFVFLLFALFAPFLWWGEILAKFGHF